MQTLCTLSSTQHTASWTAEADTTAVLPAGLDKLVIDSTLPVLKIGMVCAAGALSAHCGMLNGEARRALSKLAINVFTPAVMITKLGAHTDLASAMSLWYIGANVILCHFVGLGLGILHTHLLPTPPNLKHIIQVSSSIANTGNLPLVLVLSLIKSPHLPFNTAAQAELAVSYIMLGWWYATLVQMPLGTLLLHKPKTQQAQGDNAAAASSDSTVAASTGVTQNNVVSFVSSSSSSRMAGQDAQVTTTANSKQLHVQAVGAPGAASGPGLATLERPPVTAPASLMSLGLQMQSSAAAEQLQLGAGGSPGSSSSSSRAGWTAAQGGTVSSSSSSSSRDLGASAAGSFHGPVLPIRQLQQVGLKATIASLPGFTTHKQQQQPQHSTPDAQHSGPLQLLQQFVQGWWKQHAEVAEPLLKGVLSAPLIAGIVAIMIGSCPPLQAALFSSRGSLSLVGDVLDLLGQPLIPVLLLVLGAKLSNGPQLASGAHLPALNVAAVIGTKLLLSPMLGLGLILTAQRFGLIGAATDPLAILTMMVAWATPTAVLVHSLSLVHKNGEDEVSALLFYEYVAAALTLPLCSAVYLYVLGCVVPQVA